MKLQKTQIAAAVGAALLVGASAVQAQDRFTVQAYGQVSRALMFADDGTQSKWFHVDAESSGTRFGLTGTAQVMPGLRGGFRIEFDAQSNESQRVTFTPQANSSGNQSPQSSFSASDEDHGGFSERHMDAWLEGAWGRVNMGQGDGAANGATESDLSGTGMANGIGVADLGGGINYRITSAGVTPPPLGINVNASINQQDFESRYDRLMYVTPTFGGFRGQLSWGQKAASGITTTAPASFSSTGQSVTANTDVKELALWYGGKGGFGEIAAAVGWSERGANVPGGTKDEYIGGSVSWLANFGLNVTLSWSERTQPLTAAQQTAGFTLDSTFTYLKVGYKFGAHAIALDYAIGEDFSAKGDEAKMMGIGYVWNPIRWLELFAAYKVHSLDRSGSTNGATVTAAATLEDVTIGTIGTRIRF